jgi:hypothetical protein
MWIHEAGPSNPLYDLVQQYSLNISELVNYNSGAVYDPQGKTSPLIPYIVSAAVSTISNLFEYHAPVRNSHHGGWQRSVPD